VAGTKRLGVYPIEYEMNIFRVSIARFFNFSSLVFSPRDAIYQSCSLPTRSYYVYYFSAAGSDVYR